MDLEHKSFSAETQHRKNNRCVFPYSWLINFHSIPVDIPEAFKVRGVVLVTKSTRIVFCIKYILYNEKTVKNIFKMVKNIFIYEK